MRISKVAIALLCVAMWSNSQAVPAKSVDANKGTGAGSVTVGTATYGYNAGFPGDGGTNFDISGVPHLFHTDWFYRVTADTREFAINGTPTDSNFLLNTITLTYADVGTRGLFGAVAVDQLQNPSSNGGAAVHSTLTLTNISGVAQTVTVFRYLDADLNGSAGGDAANAIGTANNHLRVTDTTATLNLTGDGDSYAVTTYNTLLAALNDTAVDNLANSGVPFGPGDFTGGMQWSAVTLGPGASSTFSVDLGIIVAATSNGGPGEDSDQAIAAAGTVVNSYSTLTAQAGSTFTVASAAALALPVAACPSLLGGCVDAASRALQRGDLLLVYQPQGATIDTTNTVAYGSVSSYNSAGLYEYVYVDSVAGDVITIADSDSAAAACSGGLRFTYAAGAMVVRVPQYSNLTVNAASSIVAPAWNGSTGGVVAIHVGGSPISSTGTLTVNGSIDVSALGFRGGVRANRAVSFGSAGFLCADPAGAQKGEGIAGGIFGSGTDLCRGAPANGGGGGNNHNAGGGGGANGGFDTSIPVTGGWTRGIGVFPPGPGGSGPGSPFSFTPAWTLDPEIDPDGAGPGLAQTNTGGGRGGYTYGSVVNNPQVFAPGDGAAWAGDARRVVGGLGGRPLQGQPLIADPYRRLFFGGGGGAGEMNDTQGGSGGAGGGLAFVIAQDVLGAGQILADGAVGQSTAGGGNNDAPGGGGGGGTVVMDSLNVPAALTLAARGGAGGNQLAIVTESEGAGGGGGGGVVMHPGGGTVTLAGGVNGNSDSDGLRDTTDAAATRRFPPNGATGGAAGSLDSLPARDGANSPFVCLVGPAFTTPVTNAYFQTTSDSSRLTRVEFASAAEVAQVGYFLYAQNAAGTRQRVGGFIPTRAGSADRPQNYQVALDLPAGTSALYLAEVDIRGREILRGPFALGEIYGALSSSVDYDWHTSQNELAAFTQQPRGGAASVARLGVRERGMQRITHEQLLAAGVDFSGHLAQDLAVVADTGPVSRRIRGGSVFGSGSSIEFFGDANATLWSRDQHYLLVDDSSRARDMELKQRPVSVGATSTYAARLNYAPQVGYNEASPVGDPWYADRLLAYGNIASKTVPLTGPAPTAAGGVLELVLWGGIDWPGVKADHSVEVWFNGQRVASERFDGVSQARLRIPVTVSSGNSTVEIRLPLNTSYVADIVYVESVDLHYRAAAAGDGNRFFGGGLTGSAWDTIFHEGGGEPVGAPIAGVVTIANVGGSDLRAYRVVGGTATEYAVSGTPTALYSFDFSAPGELWVSPTAQLLTPSVSQIAAPAQLFGGATDWLVITHGMFAPALPALVADRQAQGLATRVVDVSAIYAQYSAGNPDPRALRSYIAAARATMGVDYVLLVGADTLDAPGYLGSGSISFVPTPYVTTSQFVRYAPGDPLLADGTGDGVPDLAIGRLPVRTLAEAQEAVRKILAYEDQPASSKVMISAGALDPYAPETFTNDAESFSNGLAPIWDVDRVYQDSLGLNLARLRLVSGFDSGRSLVSYMGHSGPTRWTFDPLLDISQVVGTSSDPGRPNLAPSVNQPIVLQYACWTTYFVSPTQNTMAQALMLTPNRGASAIVGATVLLDQISHERMAAALAGRLQLGTRIGDALHAAKMELANDAANPAGPEVLLGQVLLGDPAQRIR